MLKSKAFKALFVFMTVFIGSSFAVAPEKLQWRDLVNHPERWPAKTTITVELNFTQATLSVGTEVQIFKVSRKEVQLISPQNFLFALKPDQCNLLADANIQWSNLSVTQRGLTWKKIVADRSLWPDTIAFTSPIQFEQITLDAGEKAQLVVIEGNDVAIAHPKLQNTLLVSNIDTDIFVRARDLVDMPMEKRPGVVPSVLSGRTIDADGNVTTLGPAQYYVFYFAASSCPRCKVFSPKLVEHYSSYLANRDDVEFIVWSTERPKSNIQAYMRQHSMPWSTLSDEDYSIVRYTYQRPGSVFQIPGLLVVDRFGNELLATNKIPGQPIAAAEVALSRLNEVLDK